MNSTCLDTPTRPMAGASTTTTPPRPTGTNLPIRRVGAIEVPAAGHWPLQTTSYVVHSAKHGEREQLHVRGGWLDVDGDPAQCWLHIDLGGRALDLTAISVAEDSYGLSVWHLTGVADDGDRRDAVTMTLRYHGVYRRGDLLFAWFSGTAVIEGDAAIGRRSTRRPAERLHLDLLFESR